MAAIQRNTRIDTGINFIMEIDATTTAPTKATTRTELGWWRRIGNSMEITYTYRYTSILPAIKAVTTEAELNNINIETGWPT